jgi:DnaJ family protein A protein 2
MSDTKDYYQVLGVDKTASKDAIKKAYRDLAKKMHPDKNQNTPENPNNKETSEIKFKELTEAHEVLSDEEQRTLYDQLGHDNYKTRGQRGGHNENQSMQDMVNMMMGGMGGMMGGMGGMMGSAKNDNMPNVDSVQEFSLEDLYTGVVLKTIITRTVLCKPCAGTGNADSKKHKCKKCSGNGMYMKVMQRGPMTMQQQVRCDDCNGNGTDKNIKKCSTCDGKQGTAEKKEMQINVPKGAGNNQTITIPEEGNEIPFDERKNKKTRTDVNIHIKEKDHKLFTRSVSIGGSAIDPANLLMNVEITFAESICGFHKTFTHLDGKEFTLKINNLVKHEEIIIIKNKGMPIFNKTEYGELFVRFNIKYPDEIPKQIKIRLWQLLTNTPYQVKETDTAKDDVVIIPNNEYRPRQQNSGQRQHSGFNFPAGFEGFF